MSTRISVVIPVYNKLELFKRNLKINFPYLQDCEIIVVDDASSEDVQSFITSEYPKITYIKNEMNLGFSPTVNVGINRSHGDMMLLLNTDVTIKENPQRLLTYFEKNQKLFAVSFAQIEKNGEVVGKNRLYFDKGFVMHSKAHNLKPGLNAWAEGGACLIQRKYLNKLGNFCEMYAPFYWEDIDLSYRAYAAGWEIYFDPSYVVNHQHESTIHSFFDTKYVKTIAYRNQFIFTWLNMHEKNYLKRHVQAIPGRLIHGFVHSDFAIVRGFFMAILLLPDIRKIRSHNGAARVVKDSTIFDRLG